MKISDGRINTLSRKIAKSFISNKLTGGVDEDKLAKEIKRGFNFFVQGEASIDLKVREKIKSLKRGVPEGSSEWDILYRQYFNEEMSKL